MRAAHLLCLAAICLTLATAARGRELRQDSSPSPSSDPSPSPSPCNPLDDFLCNAPSDGSGTGCGTLGQACCEKELDDYTFVLACNSDEHYCLQFPPSPTAGQGDSPPTLCLPRPEVCGAAAGSCCPLTGDTENGSQRCNDQDTLCLAPNSTTIYGSLTYDDYRTFKANPYAQLPNATAASVFGTCTVFPVDQCGMEGGLCGRPLAEPAPQCPAGKRTCESWLYCKAQEGQFESFGLCTEIPLGCGDLGGPCCPYGNYSVGKFPTPFCWAPNVFCAANSRNISDTLCRPLPLSPKQCGAPGGPCCPSAYGLVTDKPLPPPCQDGAYCVGGGLDSKTTGFCMLNPPDCGKLAKPCCARDGRVGTVYECDPGFYCPDEGDSSAPATPGNTSSGGVQLYADAGPGARVCQECNAMVSPQYQVICDSRLNASPGPSPPPSPPPRPPYPPIFYPPFAAQLPPAAMPPGGAPSPLVAPAPGAGQAPAPELPSPSPAPSPLAAPPPSPAVAPPPSPGFVITEGPAAAPPLPAPGPGPTAAPPLPAPGPGPAAAPAPAPTLLPGDFLAPELAPGPGPAMVPVPAPLPGPAPAPAPGPSDEASPSPDYSPSPSPDEESPSPSPDESPSPSPDYEESPSPNPDYSPSPDSEDSPSPSPDESPSPSPDESPSPSPDESPSPSPDESPSPSPDESPSPSPDESPSPSPERRREARLRSPSPNWCAWACAAPIRCRTLTRLQTRI
ncbi:hypothetical protein ABPG77_008940 [Micractinium sp. CCAP 211/92]